MLPSSFYVGAGVPNSHPHEHTVESLTLEHLLSPRCFFLMDDWINKFSLGTERNERVSHDNDRVGIYLDYNDLMSQGSKSTPMVTLKILVVPVLVGGRAGVGRAGGA